MMYKTLGQCCDVVSFEYTTAWPYIACNLGIIMKSRQVVIILVMYRVTGQAEMDTTKKSIKIGDICAVPYKVRKLPWENMYKVSPHRRQAQNKGQVQPVCVSHLTLCHNFPITYLLKTIVIICYISWYLWMKNLGLARLALGSLIRLYSRPDQGFSHLKV